ncbi:MAG: hypothetical protein H7A25_09595 [Leptospiraceae bacterium]|nr:SiaB family protein kinase [Leptospiraceae bacterium]MCP5500144.1 hypothetical protein [Leptospiraceae bacterium]
MPIADQLYQQYQEIQSYRSIFYFKGRMSQEILGELGSMIKSSWSNESNMRRMFAVFIELAQNILHYSAEKIHDETGRENGVGIIILNEEEDVFRFHSGNLVHTQKANELIEKCKFINSLDKDELRKLYKEKIKGSRPEDSKGAGLGFIDMARKSDRPLGFKLDPIDEEYSFFTLSVCFEKEK